MLGQTPVSDTCLIPRRSEASDMKITPFFALTVILLATAFSPSPTAAHLRPDSGAVAGTSLGGDIDCSGTVNAIDAALVLQVTAGLPSSPSCMDSGDVNLDGDIDAVDAALILQFVAGLLLTLGPIDIVGGDEPLFVYTGANVLGGSEVTLADAFRLGKPVVLSFWAGLCPPCRQEMPQFQALYDERQDEFLMLGIDVGRFTGLGSQDDAGDLLDELGITYPTAYVDSSRLLREYNIFGMPGAAFVAADGEIISTSTGHLSGDDIIDRVLKLIEASN